MGKKAGYGVKTQRKCHDCGKKCDDYRCGKCWAKRRKKLNLPQHAGDAELDARRLDDEWVYY